MTEKYSPEALQEGFTMLQNLAKDMGITNTITIEEFGKFLKDIDADYEKLVVGRVQALCGSGLPGKPPITRPGDALLLGYIGAASVQVQAHHEERLAMRGIMLSSVLKKASKEAGLS